MQIKLKLALTLVLASYVHAHAQQTIAYTCDFTNTIGAKWVNGAWVDAKFYPRKSFSLKLENGSVDVKSIAELLGGWGGINTACTYIDSVGSDTKHFRCVQTSVSSKMLIFNPASKNGALVSPDGALVPDTWKTKDDIGLEVFKCK